MGVQFIEMSLLKFCPFSRVMTEPPSQVRTRGYILSHASSRKSVFLTPRGHRGLYEKANAVVGSLFHCSPNPFVQLSQPSGSARDCVYAGRRSSVRKVRASASAFALNSRFCGFIELGRRILRVATEMPSSERTLPGRQQSR